MLKLDTWRWRWLAVASGLIGLTLVNQAAANPYPPDWIGGTGPAVHYAPVAWPANSAWVAYTLQGTSEMDKGVQDPSNGGTSPQNYVNVTSGCTDITEPSVYYAYDPGLQVVFFRWRVQQQANTYATGPSAGAYAATDPWRSALWTVLIDIDGDGYKEFAVQLDGSSGAPAAAIDRLTSYYSNNPNQMIDPTDPNTFTLTHNPAAFTSGSMILNFHQNLTPDTNWPSGSGATVWDYGTSRSMLVPGTTCGEFFVDYQIPLGMLDATAFGGPKITPTTPFSMLFTTSNSLQNPLQKDVVFNGDFIGTETTPGPFGDLITLTGTVQQPIVRTLTATGCGATTLTANVVDSLAMVGGTAVTTVAQVQFYYYFDSNNDGTANDGNAWTLIGNAAAASGGNWTRSWDSTVLPQGQYLIGVQAIDTAALNADGKANRTFSYLSPAQVALLTPPAGEHYFANPDNPGVKFTTMVNTCGLPPPYLTKSVSPAIQTVGSPVTFTITVHNTYPSAITVSSIVDTLPVGFTYVNGTTGGTLGVAANPTVALPTLTWSFAPLSVPASSTRTLTFNSNVSTATGTYSNTATAVTSAGTIVCDPVQIGVGAARLTLAKTASLTSANPGDTVTFTMTYSNDSPIAVTAVTLTDPIPTGATFVAGSLRVKGVAQTDANDGDQAYYNAAGPNVAYSLGDLASGDGPYTVSYSVTVNTPYPDAAPDPMVNTATITGTGASPVAASTSLYINVPRPNLVIQKDGGALLAPGAQGTYILSYKNIGNATATSTVITDAVPNGFTFVSATGGGTSNLATPPTITWNIGSVAANATGSVTVTIQASNPYTGSANPAINTAAIVSAQTTTVSDTFKIGITQVGNSTCFAPSTFYDNSDGSSTLSTVTTQDTVNDSLTWTAAGVKTGVYQDFTFPVNMIPANATITAATATFVYLEKATTFAQMEAIAGGTGPTTTFTIFKGTTGKYITDVLNFLVPQTNLSTDHAAYPVVSGGALSTPATLNGLILRFRSYSTSKDGPSTNARADTDYIQFCVTYAIPPDLVIDKQVDKLAASPGDTLQYTIRFSNKGGANATGTNILDTLPPNVTFVSATLNGVAKPADAVAGQNYTFNVHSTDTATVGQVTAAQAGTLVINATVNAPLAAGVAPQMNSATLDSNETNPVSDTATTAILMPALSLAKAASDTLLIPGDTVTYTITVLNSGKGAAANVVVTDDIPDQNYFEYVAGSIAGGTSRSTTGSPVGSVSWTIASLASGAAATLTFQMRVRNTAPLPPDGTTTLGNAASETNGSVSGTVTSNTVTVAISTTPNLRLTKSVITAGPYTAGEEITYSLLVENIGSATATTIQVLDAIPSYTSYVTGSLTVDSAANTDAADGDAGRFEAVSNRVAFAFASLASGAAHTVAFHVRVNSPMPNGTTAIPNTATVSAGNTATKSSTAAIAVPAAPILTLNKLGPGSIPYPATTLNGAVTTSLLLTVTNATFLKTGQLIRVSGQDRTITAINGNNVTIDSPVTAANGATVYLSLVYNLVYTNKGTADATGVTIEDTLPGSYIYISSTPAPASGPNPLHWNLGTVAAGAAGNIQVVTFPGGTGDLVNSATLDSNETTPVTDTLTTGVGTLIVGKTTSTPIDTNGQTGSTARYIITVTNTRGIAATGVAVTDHFESGFSYASTESIVNSGGTVPSLGYPAAGSTQPVWGNFTIAANSTLTLTFIANISTNVGPDTYQNAVSVTSTNIPVLPFDELTTTAEDVAVTVPYADLSLVKTASNPYPIVGNTETFTLALTNSGPDTATNISVRDVLPNGYSYVAASIAGGDSRSAAGNPTLTWTVNSLANGATVNLTYQAVVQAKGAGVSFTNAAQVMSMDQFDPDSVPGDGSGDDFSALTVPPVTADLSLVKTPSNPTPNVGNTVTFTLALTNSGPDTATNIHVQDVLPNGCSYVAASIAGGDSRSAAGSPTLTWTVNSLANGATVNLTCQAVVLAPTAGRTFINTAQVMSVDQHDPDSTPGDGAGDDYSSTTLTPQQADLSLVKTPSNPTPVVGETVTFTLALTNGGPNTATNIHLQDLLPNGYSYVAASIAGGNSRSAAGNPTLTWTVTSLANGATVNLTYQAVVQAVGGGVVYANAAQVMSVDQYDPDSTPGDGTGDDSSTTNATPNGNADLSLTKTPSTTTPNVGDTVTFTIVVSNAGPVAASNIHVQDALPNGYSYVPASIAGGSSRSAAGNPTLTWTINALYPTNTATLTYQAVMRAPASGRTFTNTAQVMAVDQPDPDSTPGDGIGDDCSSVTLTPQEADLSLVKTPSKALPNVGETVTFTLAVTNSGPDTATNIHVQDILPNGYSYVAASITGGDSRSAAGNPTLTWTISSLANGATVNLTYQATVLAPIAGRTYTNAAQVMSVDQFDPDSTPGDGTGDDYSAPTVAPAQADLSLVKTTSAPIPYAGETVTFTLALTNSGPDTATSIHVQDVLPNGYSYVAASMAGGDSRSAAGNPFLTWTVNSLANGATVNLTYQAVVQAKGAGVTFTNAAQVMSADQYDPDSTPGDGAGDDFSALTVPPLAADLSLSKSPSNPTPNVGDTVTFTIALTNGGPDTATNISVRDVLPNGYSYVAASIAGGDSRSAAGDPTLTWTVASLANGATVNLTYQAVVQAPTAGVTFANAAQVMSVDQHDPDSTPGDGSGDDFSAVNVPPLQADLSLVKTPSNMNPSVGNTVTFTIALTNGGPNTATNIHVQDVLPNGYSYVAASITGGDSRSAAGNPILTWTINTLANGATVNLTYQAVVQATGPGVTYTNAAEVMSVDQYDPDSTPGDGAGDDFSTVNASPAGSADLSLVKTPSTATPNVGATVTFTLALTNSGPNTATNVNVEDVLPNGCSYVAASIAGGDSRSAAGNPTLTWTVASLANGATVNLTYQVTVLAPTAGRTYTNAAQVTAVSQTDPDSTPGDNTGDDYSTATLTPQQADLSLSKTPSKALPNVGETVTFTLALTNSGPDTATNIAVRDVLPNGYSYVAASITGGNSRSAAGNPILTWTVSSLANGATVNLTYQAVVQTPGAGVTYTNTAQVMSVDQYDPDSTPGDGTGDDFDAKTVAPAQADLALTKNISDTTPAVGETVTFTIALTNGGPNTATNIAVRDVLPNGYSYVAASITGGDSRSAAGNPILTWTVNSLANGATVNLTYQVVVQAKGAGVTFTNAAQVMSVDQYDPDSTPGDGAGDDFSALTVPPVAADLSLSKSPSNPTPNVGDTVTFTLALTNSGPDTATNISVRDVLPNGCSYVAASIAGGDSRSAAGDPTLTWTVSSLANGATVNLTYQAVVQAPGAGITYTNAAQVMSADQIDPDSTPGDGAGDDFSAVNVPPLQADLSLVKTPSNLTPAVGDTVTFTLALTNGGPNTATNIHVQDVLPNGYSYVAASIAGGNSRSAAGDPTLTWTVSSLANGATVNLSYDAVVQDPIGGKTYINTAQVMSVDQYDPDSTPGDGAGDDYSTTNATPAGSADLSLTKTPSNAMPNVGDTVTFTITVSNAGPVAATNINVQDVLPNGYSYVAASITGGSSRSAAGNPTLTWTVNTLYPANTATLTYQAVVQAPTAGRTYTNAAQVMSATQPDPDSTPGDGIGDDFSAVNVPPLQADLSLVKTPSKALPNVGETVTFTLALTNSGPDTATNISVRDILPNGCSYVAASIAGGDSRNAAGNPTLTWTVNSLANGATVNLTYQAVVLAPIAGRTYTNAAQVMSVDQYDPDSTPGDGAGDDFDAKTVAPAQADLSLIKTTWDPTPNVGETVTFTLALTNGGSDTATNIAVRDVLPNGYSYVAASITGGDSRSAVGNPTLTWTVTSLANGATVNLTYQAVVQATGPGVTYTNAAQVMSVDQYDPDSTPGDGAGDDFSAVTAPPQTADLSLTKTSSDTTPAAGETVTFTIALTNSGPDTATNIGVQDVLPNGYSYVAASIAGGSSRSAAGNPTLTWTVASLANGATVNLTYQAVVQATGGGVTYTNAAQVMSADQQDPDSTPGDGGGDDFSALTLPPVSADLSLLKTPSTLTPLVGDTVTFTIALTNSGPDTATNIDVQDVLPNGYSYAAASITGGSTRSAAGNPYLTWTVASLANGATVNLTYDAVVLAPAGGRTYTNAAEVMGADQFDPDSAPADGMGDDFSAVNVPPLQADLSLSKTPSNMLPLAGDTVTFTLAVHNSGPDTATNVAVQDILPNGYSYVAASIAGGSSRNAAGNPTLTWAIASLANGATANLTYQAVVQTPGGGVTYTNAAQVMAADQYDPDSTPGDGAGDDFDAKTVPPAGTVTGTIYVDNNGNGAYDAGDTPLPNVTVTVTDARSNVYTLTTGIDGVYRVNTAPGSATVNVNDADLPPDATLTAGNTDPTTVTVVSNATVTSDTGYVLPVGTGVAQGTVYQDLNGNGVFDAGDTPIPNVDVIITKSDATTVTVVTDTNGYFEVEVPAGSTIVEVDQTDPQFPAGVTLTDNAGGQGSNPTTISVPSGGAATDNTGYITPPAGSGTVQGTVYVDTNNNGVYDAGDVPLPDVAVTIIDSLGGI